jgi:hypothetical protein
MIRKHVHINRHAGEPINHLREKHLISTVAKSGYADKSGNIERFGVPDALFSRKKREETCACVMLGGSLVFSFFRRFRAGYAAGTSFFSDR